MVYVRPFARRTFASASGGAGPVFRYRMQRESSVFAGMILGKLVGEMSSNGLSTAMLSIVA